MIYGCPRHRSETEEGGGATPLIPVTLTNFEIGFNRYLLDFCFFCITTTVDLCMTCYKCIAFQLTYTCRALPREGMI